jgi:Leucine-rich repeat (LRR) protein
MNGITNNVLTLQDLAASQVIQRGFGLQQKAKPCVVEGANALLMNKWQALKANPTIQRRYAAVMRDIEAGVLKKERLSPLDPAREQVLTEKVSDLFLNLGARCYVSSYFCNIIPVNVQAYINLNQEQEDEALSGLWMVVKPAQLGAAAPLLLTPKEIRVWLPANGITELNLTRRKIKVIPPEIGFLTQLRRLDLGCNQISSIPDEIRSCTQLRILNLYSNEISSISAETAQFCRKLAICNMNRNLFAWSKEDKALLVLWEAISSQLGAAAPVLEVPERITDWLKDPENKHQLTKIKQLILQNKKIWVIPPEIRFLPQLEVLYLGFNKISVIPDEIGSCTQLQTLHLGSNRISNISPEIKRCSQLSCLNLNWNQISLFQPEICSLLKLNFLQLDDNKIESIPPEIMSCTQLVALVLCRNKIKSIPPDTLEFCNKLPIFRIDSNPIPLSLQGFSSNK